MKHTICLRSYSQAFPLPLLVSVSMPLQGQSKVKLTSSVTGWVCRLQRCSKFLRHQENWAQLASHQWDPVQLTHDRSVTQYRVLIYSFLEMLTCSVVYVRLQIWSPTLGAGLMKTNPRPGCDPTKTDSHLILGPRTLKNVGSVLSESSLRPKSGSWED